MLGDDGGRRLDVLSVDMVDTLQLRVTVDVSVDPGG